MMISILKLVRRMKEEYGDFLLLPWCTVLRIRMEIYVWLQY